MLFLVRRVRAAV